MPSRRCRRSTSCAIVAERAPNIGVVTAYNDMLSAHQPYERFPAVIRDEAHRLGATAQVAGGVPAMCDGVTQGRAGMELSLFSRDTIAMGTAIALSHDVFDAALLLGICDKIVPGPADRRAALRPPAVRVRARRADGERPVEQREDQGARAVRAGPGRPRRAARRRVGRRTTAPAPAPSTAPPTATRCCSRRWACTCPARPSCIRTPSCARRSTREAVRTVLANAAGQRRRRRAASRRSAGWSTSASIVNAMVALLATGGSTNHLIHWVAVARSAGIVIDWTDFSELSRVDAAAGARLSERQRRREPVPGRRRPRLRDPRAARGRLPARRRRHRRRRRPRRLHPRAASARPAGSPGRRCPRRAATTAIVRRPARRSARTAA